MAHSRTLRRVSLSAAVSLTDGAMCSGTGSGGEGRAVAEDHAAETVKAVRRRSPKPWPARSKNTLREKPKHFLACLFLLFSVGSIGDCGCSRRRMQWSGRR